MNTQQLGILGGGQLAQMLVEAALRMGHRPLVLAESPQSPVAQIYPDVIYGDLNDEKALGRFFSQVGLVVFENEFVNSALLRSVSNRISREKELMFFPNLEVISQFQNKLEQKKILESLEIPTAEYRELDFKRDLSTQLTEIIHHFGGSCILKWARMGYDGKGVLSLQHSSEDFKKAEIFCAEAAKKLSPVYAERKIDFRHELAAISVYSVTQEFISYPLVISEQSKGICLRVKGPASVLGVAPEQEMRAREYALKIAQSSGLVGSFALELFETSEGRLLINEIAPRVHNSGHFTQDACATSQFENHWRAVLGLPLGNVACSPGFAMLNILGPDLHSRGHDPKTSSEIRPEPGSRSYLHWYHKSELRPGRKLGHLNGRTDSSSDLDSLLAELENSKENWIKELSK